MKRVRVKLELETIIDVDDNLTLAHVESNIKDNIKGQKYFIKKLQLNDITLGGQA